MLVCLFVFHHNWSFSLSLTLWNQTFIDSLTDSWRLEPEDSEPQTSWSSGGSTGSLITLGRLVQTQLRSCGSGQRAGVRPTHRCPLPATALRTPRALTRHLGPVLAVSSVVATLQWIRAEESQPDTGSDRSGSTWSYCRDTSALVAVTGAGAPPGWGSQRPADSCPLPACCWQIQPLEHSPVTRTSTLPVAPAHPEPGS